MALEFSCTRDVTSWCRIRTLFENQLLSAVEELEIGQGLPCPTVLGKRGSELAGEGSPLTLSVPTVLQRVSTSQTAGRPRFGGQYGALFVRVCFSELSLEIDALVDTGSAVSLADKKVVQNFAAQIEKL